MKIELKDETQTVFFQIEHLSDKNIIQTTWIADGITVDQIKDGAMIMLEQLKKNNTSLILNDNRKITGAWDEANEWIANEWMPKAIEIGVRKFAHIISDDIFDQLSAEFMQDNSKKVEGEFQMRLFDNLEEAEEWLLA
ncbi:hypothetical protein V9L05_05040 [Bernardetia sp. Wsw4-3y2]|uniref:hypothetical protein n=1 Tax=unclassified Bernardetia TaxID=2647129 RepID=UPI0030D315A5